MDPELEAQLRAQAEAEIDEEMAAEQAATDPPDSPTTPPVEQGEALARGAVQGGSFGLSDEAIGFTRGRPESTWQRAAQMLLDSTTPQGLTGGALRRAQAGTVSQEIDRERALNQAAQTDNPWTYGAGSVAGSLAVPGVGLVSPWAQGALRGAGESDTDDPLATLEDAGEGAATAVALDAIGTGVGGIGALGVRGAARALPALGRIARAAAPAWARRAWDAGRALLPHTPPAAAVPRAAPPPAPPPVPAAPLPNPQAEALQQLIHPPLPPPPAQGPHGAQFADEGLRAAIEGGGRRALGLAPTDLAPAAARAGAAGGAVPPTAVQRLGRLRAAIGQAPDQFPPDVVQAAASGNPVTLARADYVAQQSNPTYRATLAELMGPNGTQALPRRRPPTP